MVEAGVPEGEPDGEPEGEAGDDGMPVVASVLVEGRGRAEGGGTTVRDGEGTTPVGRGEAAEGLGVGGGGGGGGADGGAMLGC